MAGSDPPVDRTAAGSRTAAVADVIPHPERLGFLAVGVMNAAIIRGILKAAFEGAVPLEVQFPLLLSPRSFERVSVLQSEYGADWIEVCADNDEVLAKADIVFLGCRPDHVRDLVAGLRMPVGHRSFCFE